MKRELPVLERVETDEFRLYKTPDGKSYPSVTTVLGVLPKTELEEWKKRVGEEEAARVSARATTRGTAIHDLSERYLRNLEIPKDSYNPLYMFEWEPLKRSLKENVDNVLGCELMMYSDRLQMAGTTDLIADWKGKRSIIDFKTSTRWKHESEIENYFVQTCCYSIMAHERLGETLVDLIILMVTDGGEMLVFEKKVYDYYSRALEVRKMFKDKNGF